MNNKSLEKKWCNISFGVSRFGNSGVAKKILMQSKAIECFTRFCDSIFFDDETIYYEYSDMKKNKTKSQVKEIVSGYDVFYIRWGGLDSYFNRLIKEIKRSGKICTVEVPTYPMIAADFGLVRERFRRGRIFSSIRLLVGIVILDMIAFSLQKRYMDYCVLTSDARINGVRSINIFNGIDVEMIEPREMSDIGADSFFNLLIVANISVWHGIDRVIKGISEYGGNKPVRLYVVGDGEELDHLVEMTRKNNIEDKVIFVGKKNGEELDYYYNTCDVAIGSLGLHRLNVRSSTIKSKEYMARGIPFLASASENLPHEKDMNWVYTVEDNESPIDISKIIEWAEDLDYRSVSLQMRKYAEERFSWKIQMKKVIDAIGK